MGGAGGAGQDGGSSGGTDGAGGIGVRSPVTFHNPVQPAFGKGYDGPDGSGGVQSGYWFAGGGGGGAYNVPVDYTAKGGGAGNGQFPFAGGGNGIGIGIGRRGRVDCDGFGRWRRVLFVGREGAGECGRGVWCEKDVAGA